jgi:isopenicillin N synthase-like dioxygenase
MEHYYDTCQRVGSLVLEALEVGLKLSSGSLQSKCNGGASEIRLNHYPAVNIHDLESGKISRIWPHTDLGVITFLFQDSNGGLEMEDRQTKPGTFVPIPKGSFSEMVINIGETFQRWT